MGKFIFLFWTIVAFFVSGAIGLSIYIYEKKPAKHMAAGYIFCFLSLTLCLCSALVFWCLVSIAPNLLSLVGF